MINCPKCQVPNQDAATVCAACGAALVGHQFAQALDAEAQQSEVFATPGETVPLGMESQLVQPQMGFDVQSQFPIGQALDPSMAQVEINQFMAEQKARKRTKFFTYLAVGLVIAGVIGFFWLQGERKKKKEERVFRFYSAFRKIDDGAIANFWKCTVRAKIRDVRLANNASEITDGLSKAFSNFPRSQPDHLRDKCIPMLVSIQSDLDKLKPPEGFAAPLADLKETLKEVKAVFNTYASKIDQRKKQAIDEQEIRNMHKDFHSVIGSGGSLASIQDAPKAVQYFNIMKCVIPDLIGQARKLKKPPDSQPIVNLYHKCKENPKFGETIREECFARRNETIKRTPEFKMVAHKMAGDDRDLNAINYCFKRLNHGFAFEELKAIAKVFGKYRNKGRGNILKAVDKVKQELAD